MERGQVRELSLVRAVRVHEKNVDGERRGTGVCPSAVERDPLAVRRPDWRAVYGAVVRQPALVRAVRIHDIDLLVAKTGWIGAVPIGGKDDLRPQARTSGGEGWPGEHLGKPPGVLACHKSGGGPQHECGDLGVHSLRLRVEWV